MSGRGRLQRRQDGHIAVIEGDAVAAHICPSGKVSFDQPIAAHLERFGGYFFRCGWCEAWHHSLHGQHSRLDRDGRSPKRRRADFA